VFEIFWDQEHNRVLVQEFDDYFLLHSPDIQNLTIFNVLEALGYGGEQVLVTWTSDNQNDTLLNSTVENAALSQLSIYSPNQPIPQNPYMGPLPRIAGEPIPVENPNAEPFQNAPVVDQPNDDDNQSVLSELSDMPNYRIVDRFDNDDDDSRQE
jgi:hypothetical protein